VISRVEADKRHGYDVVDDDGVPQMGASLWSAAYGRPMTASEAPVIANWPMIWVEICRN
jgi:hypothetical protein